MYFYLYHLYFSYSSAPPSNSYQFNDLINKSDSKEEVPLFTLSIEDIMKNPRLKHALVSFDSLTIQKEIGHGRCFQSGVFT